MNNDVQPAARDQAAPAAENPAKLLPTPSNPLQAAQAPEPITVPEEALTALIDYSLLSTVAYSTSTKEVYASLQKHAPALFNRILPLQSAQKKEVHLATGDNLVRVNLLKGSEAGSAEAVVAFVGPDDLSAYKPSDKFPVASSVALLDSWPAGTPDNGIKVHGSFLQAFNALVKGQRGGQNLADQVKQLAASLNVSISKITFVGHAVGGAFATIGCYWIKKVAFPNADVSCVTFGAPRVGNPAFVTAFTATVSSSLRAVHKADPLSDVPSHDYFQHVSGGIHLYEPSDNTTGAPEMSNVNHYVGVFMEPPSPLYAYDMNDNAVLAYVNALTQAAARKQDLSVLKGLQDKWGKLLQDGWVFDSPVAEVHELESIVKQLQQYDSGKAVKLAPPELTAKLIKYGSWAAAAYAHHVSITTEKKIKNGVEILLSAKNTLRYWMEGGRDERGNLVGSQEDLGPVMGDTLRLLVGKGALKESWVFSTDTQALIGLIDLGGDNVELVIAFRGSEQKVSDWITNFTLSVTSVDTLVPKGKNHDSWQIHSGFTDSVNDVVAPNLQQQKGPLVGLSDGESFVEADDKSRKECPGGLKEAVAAILPPGKKITKVVTCGHSLGGALSKLAAYWCQKVGWPDVPVENYNFGAPRICNWEFAQEWRKTIKTAYRVVHRADPVPAVPFASWLADLDYHHVDDSVLLCQPKMEPFRGVGWPGVVHSDDYQAHLRRRPTPLTAIIPMKQLLVVADDHSMQSRPAPPKKPATAAAAPTTSSGTGKGVSPFNQTVPLVTPPSYLDALTRALKAQTAELSAIDSLKAKLSVAGNMISQGMADLPGMLSQKMSQK